MRQTTTIRRQSYCSVRSIKQFMCGMILLVGGYLWNRYFAARTVISARVAASTVELLWLELRVDLHVFDLQLSAAASREPESARSSTWIRSRSRWT
jgi:hypothetical protein